MTTEPRAMPARRAAAMRAGVALVMALLGWASFAPRALAQACSADEAQAIVSRTLAANAAARQGQLEGFVAAMKALPSQVPPGCRGLLERLQPMASRCNAEEKGRALNAFAVIVSAAAAGDLRRLMDAYDGLERSVGRRCWIAVNMRTEPEVVARCTPAELEGLAAQAAPVLRATMRALGSGDMSGLMQAMGGLPQFSPPCAAAIQRHSQQPRAGAGGRPAVGAPASVNDHGNGTLSVNGVGACGPSGCIAF